MCEGHRQLGRVPPNQLMVNSLIERRQLESGDRKWCKECSEALCENCAKVHRAFKATKHHTIVAICKAKDIYPEPEETLDCQLHKNRKVELFCYDHEIPCCLTCMTVHHRKCEKVTTLDEAAENFRESSEVSDLLTRLISLTSDLNEEVENHEKMEREFESQIRDVREEVRKSKESVLRHVESLYKAVNDEVSALEKGHAIGDDKEKLLQQKMQLELSVKTLDTMKSKSSNIALFLEYHKIKAREKKHSEAIEEHRAKCEKQTVEFVINDKVKTFKTSITSLGEIRVSRSPCYAQSPVSIDFTTCTWKEVLTIQERGTRFTDAVFLNSDVIVAVDDYKNTLWAYDSQSGKITSLKLPSDPWALAAVSDKDVVVSLRGSMCLQCFTFEASDLRFTIRKTITMQDTPFAVDFADGYLFVTLPHKSKKMKRDGTVVMEIDVPNSYYLYGIAHSGDDVATPCHSPNQNITILGPNKNKVFQKQYTEISNPLGLTADRNGNLYGNLYVVGYSSNNVIQLSPDGTLIREIIPASSGYYYPFGINFSRTENKFLLTHQDKISVFEFVSS